MPAGWPAAAAAGGSFFQRHPFLTGLAGGFLGGGAVQPSRRHGPFSRRHPAIPDHRAADLSRDPACYAVSSGAAGARARREGGLGGRPNPEPMPRAVGAAAAPAAAVPRRRHDGERQRPRSLPGGSRCGSGGVVEQRSCPPAPADDAGNARLFLGGADRNASRGVRNIVSNVRLLAGDITESWEEGDLQYATAYMKWSATDYLARLGPLAGRSRLCRRRRPEPADRVGGSLDICPAPRRQLAALGHPAGVSRRESDRFRPGRSRARACGPVFSIQVARPGWQF